MRIFLLSFVVFLGACAASPTSDFKNTLDKHLNAITSRNLDELLSTVDDSVTLIFPDGEVLESKASFAEFHRSWFADPLWVMKPTVIKTIEGEGLSSVLVRYRYAELDSGGNEVSPRTTWLNLVFKKREEGWKLIHDQNTRME